MKTKEELSLKIISKLYDERSKCYSILAELKLKSYLEVVEKIYKEQGSIEGQRGAIRTKSAKTIRDRMIDDIKKGAVLPAVVLGMVANNNPERIEDLVESDNLSLIDGMQRTTAYIEAIENGNNEEIAKLEDMTIRIEIWIGNSMNSLLYRMLVLNTGQIPWNVRRQLETIYSSVIDQVGSHVTDITLQKIDDGTKRAQAGQFPADKIMELLICFTLRSPVVNIKDAISEEFAKLDIIETSSYSNFDDYFLTSLKILVEFDKLIFSYQPDKRDESEDLRKEKFFYGKDLFTSQPARIGLITAISKYIFGLKGSKQPEDKVRNRKDIVDSKFKDIFKRIEPMSNTELGEFLAFDTLNEKTSVITSKVGDFERNFFTAAFENVFANFIELETFDMSILWRNV